MKRYPETLGVPVPSGVTVRNATAIAHSSVERIALTRSASGGRVAR